MNIKNMVSGLLLLSISLLSYADEEHDEFNVDKLTVPQSTFNYSMDEDKKWVTTLGVIKNTTGVPVEDIVVEVKYFDSNKKLIDVVTQELYSIAIPQSGEVAFRVRDAADKPQDAYVSSTARVVSATQKYIRQPKSTSFWLDMLISWGPMLLLIGVWIFLIKRVSKKGPQARCVELMEQQNTILSRQVVALELLAASAEKSALEK